MDILLSSHRAPPLADAPEECEASIDFSGLKMGKPPDDGPQRRSIKKLLLPLFEQVGSSTHNLTADSAGFWKVGADRYWLPSVVFRGAAELGEAYIRIGIFAGIHGDEPA